MKFLVLRKKRLILVAVLIAIICIAIGGGVLISATNATPADVLKVVVDAGHGGIDDGVVGKGGTKESDFNLLMSMEIGDKLKKEGYDIVYTRKDKNGLYGDTKDDFKRKDMAARKKVIQNTDPDIVVSVHANKFPGDDRRGAQVFYDDLNPEGKVLAERIQAKLNALNGKYVGREFEALSGDYYMLKCTHKPSVIVECGFLSNEEDEKLLNDPSYRVLISEAVADGIAEYLSLSKEK